jgi:hypothetical protein
MSTRLALKQPDPPGRLGIQSIGEEQPPAPGLGNSLVAEPDFRRKQRAHFEILGALLAFQRISKTTGGYVRILPELSWCPVLIGSDQRIIPLYQVVEAIDGLVDYDAIREEFPTLSYAQIHGALSFLRKIAQLNIKGIDIDEMEDEELAQDENFMTELRRGFADQEISRVLNFDERNR